MKHTIVRSKVKPEQAAENDDLEDTMTWRTP